VAPVVPRGISSAGRAPALQAGGRRFDPVILHHQAASSNVSQPEHWLGFRFDLLAINAVLFFNNLEEVKIYIEAFKRSNTRKTVQWVVIVLSTNMIQAIESGNAVLSYLCTVSFAVRCKRLTL
jgi:hypothetical protein